MGNRSLRSMLGASAILAVLTFVLQGSPLAAAGEGEALFKTKCAACHGPDGAGQTPVGKNMKIRDLRSDEVQKQSDTELSELIAKGKNKMPPFEKSLKPDQIKDLVAHIRDLGKKK
ncbi:MAG: cytochrome c [Acidobacteria bacterium]|nr:cytochrome c [Acidobacteriota bacterium]